MRGSEQSPISRVDKKPHILTASYVGGSNEDRRKKHTLQKEKDARTLERLSRPKYSLKKLAARGRELLESFGDTEVLDDVAIGEQLFAISEGLDLLEVNRVHVQLDDEEGLDAVYASVDKVLETAGDSVREAGFLLIYIEDTQRIILFSIALRTNVLDFNLTDCPVESSEDFIILLINTLEDLGLPPSIDELKREDDDNFRALFDEDTTEKDTKE